MGDCVNSLGITQLVTLLANYIASKYDTKTIGLIAAILDQLSDTLSTVVALEDFKD